MSDAAVNPLAPHSLPWFITPPGQTDSLSILAAAFLILSILGVGVIYLRIHSLPERSAHAGRKIQFELVAILGLLSLLTHNHLFWVAGLLLAFIDIPDFAGPLRSMAASLGRLSGRSADETAFADLSQAGPDADLPMAHPSPHATPPPAVHSGRATPLTPAAPPAPASAPEARDA